MKQLLLSALILLSSSLTWAAPPPQEIETGEEPLPLGELIDIYVKPLDPLPDGMVGVSYEWKVYELPGGELKPVRVYSNGVLFGGGLEPKRLLLVCSATYLYATKDVDGKIKNISTESALLDKIVQIGNPEPVPPPTPDPDSQFGMEGVVYNSIMRNIPAGRTRTDGAKALSESYAQEVLRKKLGDKLEDIMAQTRDLNNQKLAAAGIEKTQWLPVFVDIRDHFFDLYSQNKIKSMTDFDAVYQEICDGFKKGSQQ